MIINDLVINCYFENTIFEKGGSFLSRSLFHVNNKNKILEATFALSLKYGFDNVSTKRIQEEAGVSTGAIYYHFKDKNEILDAMIKKFVGIEVDKFHTKFRNLDLSLYDKLEFLFYHNVGIDLLNENPNVQLENYDKSTHTEYILFLLGVYHQHPEVRHYYHGFHREMLYLYEEFVEDLKKNNQVRLDMSTEDIALYIFTVFGGFVHLWITYRDISLETYIDKCIRMICLTIESK